MNETKKVGFGVASLVLSIVGFITSFFEFGIIFAILAIIFGALAIGLKRQKSGLGIAGLAVGIIAFIIAIVSISNSGSDDNNSKKDDPKTDYGTEKITDTEIPEEPSENDGKYHVGDTYQNKYIKITYTKCYEFSDYNQYNAPADGYKIICAEFEFENIGSSDQSVMYTDFDAYADGYEVNQSYAPDGTGIDFVLSLSSGRKGTGIVAFEVPENAEEIEIEYSLSLFSSNKVIFIYE